MSLDYGVLQNAFDRTKEIHPYILWQEGEEFIKLLEEKIETEPDVHWIKHRIDLINELEFAGGNATSRTMLTDLYFSDLPLGDVA